MAATVTIEEDIPIGGTEHLYLLKIVPGTYATGGVSVDPSSNTSLRRVQVSGGGYVAEFIPSSQLLKIYRQKDPANAGGADIALVEVANAVDLSAQTWYGIGIGS